jgi:hypothetical protein
MRNRSILLIAIILLATVFAPAASSYFAAKIVRKGTEFSFPILGKGKNIKVTTRIARLLELSELHRLVTPSTNNIFEQAAVDDGSIYGGTTYMKARIYTNSRRILSIGFDESSCGMTCTYWHRYYNFNPGNGDRMELRDLFTSEGFLRFSKKVVERRGSKYRREVRKKVQLDLQAGYLDTLGCFENDDLSDYYIQRRSIVIDGENCLIKGQKFDGLDMYVRFHPSEFRSDLNDYGRAVFGLNITDIAQFQSTHLPQLFEGTIDGRWKVVMVLNHYYEDGIRGVYSYLAYGKGIGLKGSHKDNKLVMTEFVLSDVTEMMVYGPIRKYIENGYISATLDGNLITGVWSDKSRTKSLSLAASLR